MSDLTIKEAKIIIWFLGIGCAILIILDTVEENEFMGIQLWDEDFESNYDYQLGKTVMITELYSVEELDQAISDNEIDYAVLPKNIQVMYEWWVENEN